MNNKHARVMLPQMQPQFNYDLQQGRPPESPPPKPDSAATEALYGLLVCLFCVTVIMIIMSFIVLAFNRLVGGMLLTTSLLVFAVLGCIRCALIWR